MKVGIIGYGNMAAAIVQGWFSCHVLEQEDINLSASNYDALCRRVKNTAMQPFQCNQDLVSASDCIILAVKPHILPSVMEEIRDVVKDKMVISIAVNTPFETIENGLPESHHISILPNLPIAVGKGVTVLEKKNSLTEDEKAQFERLFEPVSKLVAMDASLFSIAGTISGCGPAFVSLFIEGLADAGVAYGLPRKTAYSIAEQMVEGSALYMQECGLHPGVLKDMVCSPAGTTIRGVNSLKKNDFEGALIKAVEAIQNR